MSISFVGAQGAAAATVTIPAHQVGDMILIFAYRDGSNTPPATPTAGGTVPTWTLISSAGASTNSANFRYAVATATTTTSGTWTNATETICLVYRGTKLVGVNGANTSASTIISYAGLSLQRTDGSSWVVGCAGHRTATNVELAPTGMTNRISSGTEAAGHDTNGGVSSWAITRTVTVNANSGWRGVTVELRDATVVLTAAAGSFTETGIAATITKAVPPKVLTAAVGLFNDTLNDANLLVNRKLTADPGSYSLVGNDATITKAGLAAYTLTAVKGTYSLSPNPANVLIGRRLTSSFGAFTESGVPAGIIHAVKLVASAGSYLASSGDTPVRETVIVVAAAGTVGLNGVPATLVATRRLTASTRAFNVAGNTANILYSGSLTSDKKFYYQINETDPRKMIATVQSNNGQLVYYANNYLRIL